MFMNNNKKNKKIVKKVLTDGELGFIFGIKSDSKPILETFSGKGNANVIVLGTAGSGKGYKIK